jgi:hypothetical protein
MPVRPSDGIQKASYSLCFDSCPTFLSDSIPGILPRRDLKG